MVPKILHKMRYCRHLMMVVVATAASALLTWPLAAVAEDHVLRSEYFWDAYTNAMILGCRVDAIFGHLSIYDDYFFAPLPQSIVFNENHFGLSLVFAPFYLLSGNPLWSYNLTLLVSMALSVFFTYLLVLRLTGSAGAGIVAGVAFAFCPYALFEIGRIQLVATQWIPACFLFLHRAIEERRARDVAFLWASYALQVGTCLYYAMFLIPLLALAATVLLFQQRPPRKLYYQLGVGGLLAGALALLMVYPYFTARGGFALERTLEFASSYDGRLDFFGNVGGTNRTLTSLHHPSKTRGAYEEIAFPGFSVTALAALSLGVPLVRGLRRLGARTAGKVAARWLVVFGLATVLTLAMRSMLPGVAVVAIGVGLQHHGRQPSPFRGRRGLYLSLFLLAVVLFLGLTPMEFGGQPVRGLYYYFHTYFPGFNGIRKVSRQAVMTTFMLCVLSAYGSAWLLSRLRHERSRLWAAGLLLVGICFELRCFPHPIEAVWAGGAVPKAYAFMATLPPEDFVAVMPQNEGTDRFWGDRGMALHNYLSLYHKHRFVNGQSSYILPVTEQVRRAQIHLPDDGAFRVLASVGARHLLVHAEELTHDKRDLPAQLMARPERYSLVFQDGQQSVFSLLGADDPNLSLMETPQLPAGAEQVPNNELRARSNLRSADAYKGVDGDRTTAWWSGGAQAAGQWFELELDEARVVAALEIDNPGHVMTVPAAFELSVTVEGEWIPVVERPLLRLDRDQVFSPKTFVFRVVLDTPTLTDRVRIQIRQPMPGQAFSVAEARLYVLP